MVAPDLPAPSSVAGDRLSVVLEDAGWRRVGGRTSVYSRFAPPGEPSSRAGNLVVPLDYSLPEYAELMGAVLEELATDYRAAWERSIAPRLAAEESDELRFRRESGDPSGLISWKKGEDLVAAATAALIAGAKAYVEPGRRYYSNTGGQFAGRYLDSVYMGQTGVGSYIVTALTPAAQPIALRGGAALDTLGLAGIDTAPAGDVTRKVVDAVEATAEALAHHRSTRSFSGFDAGVTRGISVEMTSALRDLSRGAEEADVTIEWGGDPAVRTDEPVRFQKFEFRPGDADVLETVSTQFAASSPEQRATLLGRVHLLTKKQAGQPGVFGIETLEKPPRRVRIRLDDASDYRKAVRAHDEDLAIRVAGNLTREGKLSWLYHARVVETLGPFAALRDPVEEKVSHPGLFPEDE